MNILQVTSEVVPLAQVGGLADMVASLGKGLAANGHDVLCLLPAYPATMAAFPTTADDRVYRFLAGGEPVSLILRYQKTNGFRVGLVDYPELHWHEGAGGDGIYHGGPYQNDQITALRFGRFSRIAAMVAMNQGVLGWQPDIIHSHDWPTALVNLFLAEMPCPAGRVFTIHNFAHQGLVDRQTFEQLALAPQYWQPEQLEFHGQAALIKAGLIHAHQVTTVSPGYAREIAGDVHGHGLQGLVQHISGRVSGILNGIDQDLWNPATDPHLPCHYRSDALDGKRRCKAVLKSMVGINTPPEKPLLGYVGRLAHQKGVDLILDAIPAMVDRGCDLVILGDGEAQLARAIEDRARELPGRLAFSHRFDTAFAHQIMAGADLVLVPSRFEPCGLVQMYAMRYGTPPLAHRTGGLGDTISDPEDDSEQRTGFLFDNLTSTALLEAVDRALAIFGNPHLWQSIQLRAMAQDFSVASMVSGYEKVYRKVIQCPWLVH